MRKAPSSLLLFVAAILAALWAPRGLLPAEPASRSRLPRPALSLAPGGFPEAEGCIEQLLVHLDPAVTHELYPIYRDLFAALDPSVHVFMAIESREHHSAAQHLLRVFGRHASRSHVVVAGSSISVWARDRLFSLRRGERFEFLVPESGHVIGGRTEDVTVGARLASQIPGASSRRIPLGFEGGNVLIAGSRALVGRNILNDNPQWDGLGEQELRERLCESFGMEVLLVGTDAGLPHEHLDMVLTVVGPETLLLGDPRIGAGYLARMEELQLGASVLLPFDDWGIEHQEQTLACYDGILEQLQTEGFDVHRIPILHGATGGVLTWNNALIERRSGSRHAFVPAYGILQLDDLVKASYERLGLTVHPIDCSRLIHRGGAIRCTTNVLTWRREEMIGR